MVMTEKNASGGKEKLKEYCFPVNVGVRNRVQQSS